MSLLTFTNKKINNLFSFTILLTILSGCIFAASLFNTISSLESPKSANAATANTANLILGTETVGSVIKYSICVQATDGPITVRNSSIWFNFDNTTLRTTETILEKGAFSRATTGTSNGYGNLLWYPIEGSSNIYSLTVSYDSAYGDGVQMTTTPQLFAKVQFDQIAGSTGSTDINLAAGYPKIFSTESPLVPIVFTTTKMTGDCRGAATATYAIGTPVATTTNPVVGQIGGSLPTILLTGNTYPKGTVANVTLPGSTTAISGTIINGNFVPNPGQTITTAVTTGANTAVLAIGSSTVNIPVNISATTPNPTTNTSGGGGTIVICAGTCPSAQSNATSANNISTQPTTTPVVSKGTFKSKLNITDPYVCGQGAYGNVVNLKQFGVEYVYYEFYKDNATSSSYNFKLKMNDNGDFYLPISKTTNVIADGNYKIVFYAIDNEGNKAQGEYTAQIASDCKNAKVNGVSTPSTIRSGGLNLLSLLVFLLSLSVAIYLHQKIKSKDLKLKL